MTRPMTRPQPVPSMATNTFPLKYRRKSSPPPSPRMLSPIAHISSSFPTNFISPPPKWLDSDDELEHEPALTSDDALTVFSSSCSRAPSLAPLDTEDAHVDILSSPVQEAFIRPTAPSRAPLSRYNNSSYPPPNAKSPTTREDVAAALLSLRAQPRLDPSRPVLVQLPSPTESVEPSPPVRRSRVVSPSLRNLVLPRTPSPSPRRPVQMTCPVIDSEVVHGVTPSAQRTPSRRATPASSPLPPSSPFADEDEYESSELSPFHSVPCPKPKPAPLQVHITSDDSELDGYTRVQSHDDKGLEEDCDRTGLCEVAAPVGLFEDSLFPENGPDEDERLDQSCVPLLPLPVVESVDRHKSPLHTPCELTATEEPNGSRPDTPISVAPPPLTPVLPPLHLGTSLPDVADQETPANPSTYFRAASSPLTTLDEPTTPPSPAHASYPLSSPPLSPTFEHQQQQQQQQREPEHALSLPCPVVGVKRPASVALEDTDGTVVDTVEPASISASTSAPLRTKRRRGEVDSDNKPRRNRKKHHPIPIPEPPASAPTSSIRPTSPPPHVSSFATTAATSSSSPTEDPNPDEADEDDSDDFPIIPINDDDHIGPPPDPSHHHPPHHQQEEKEEKEEEQSCPHPALLGTLLETLALSRASSLPLTALTRTTPALATYPHAELTSTLAWAVRARILGCVRSSGEALPPSYFYDPAADPDRERGELLQCLMPRAGKRRETMKYKQYYWAPVVVGRGRTRTWDVDWEE